MEWNKYINDGIGEGTKKLCASIDESSYSSSRVTKIYVSSYKVVDGMSRRKKRRVLKTNRYQFVSLFKIFIMSSNTCITFAFSHKEFTLISNKNCYM